MAIEIGSRFGSVTIVSQAENFGRSYAHLGRCDCGDLRHYYSGNLKSQAHPMCPECRTKSRPARGASRGHPLFNIWKAMIQRCENENHTWYHRYGGRGIQICDAWRNDFYQFAKDMGDRPSPKHTIDRIDNDGDYCPENCRWLTISAQQSNRGNALKVEMDGALIGVDDIHQITGYKKPTIAWRIKKGWSAEKIINTPVARS